VVLLNKPHLRRVGGVWHLYHWRHAAEPRCSGVNPQRVISRYFEQLRRMGPP
jgi:hypothetical protein